jgi:hypothetical protein
MLRTSGFPQKSVLALAAVLALGSLSLATDAFARGGGNGGGGHGGGGHGGGGHFGGFHGGGFHGFAVHRGAAFRGFRVHRGFAFRHHRFFRHGYGIYPHYGYGCYRWRHVLTPYGWRLRHVNVCYPHFRHYYY